MRNGQCKHAATKEKHHLKSVHFWGRVPMFGASLGIMAISALESDALDIQCLDYILLCSCSLTFEARPICKIAQSHGSQNMFKGPGHQHLQKPKDHIPLIESHTCFLLGFLLTAPWLSESQGEEPPTNRYMFLSGAIG
jgi:hypothetical protein